MTDILIIMAAVFVVCFVMVAAAIIYTNKRIDSLKEWTFMMFTRPDDWTRLDDLEEWVSLIDNVVDEHHFKIHELREQQKAL